MFSTKSMCMIDGNASPGDAPAHIVLTARLTAYDEVVSIKTFFRNLTDVVSLIVVTPNGDLIGGVTGKDMRQAFSRANALSTKAGLGETGLLASTATRLGMAGIAVASFR